MIDVSFIRENRELFLDAMEKRGNPIDVSEILELDEKRRGLITKCQGMQSQKNKLVESISLLKRTKPSEKIDHLVEETNAITTQMESLEEDERGLSGRLYEILIRLPNILDERVPYGTDEDSNIEFKVVGKKPVFTFLPKEHHILAEELCMMDMELGTKLSGSRFSVLSGELARLYRALISLMIDIHTKDGLFREVYFPYLVKRDCMVGTGQLPKFDDNFKTIEGMYLIPTGEVPMVNMMRDEILPKESLPIRLVGYSECFRKETGSASRDVKGIFRQHQFGKVEIITICDQETSDDEHKIILSSAEKVLQALNLHYRVVLLCSGDIGFASRLTYDIEVWLPGQDKYREISSCSNTGDFQAKRMGTKYKDGKQKKFVHSLNGSGVAVGRAIIAVLENYQNEDGSITVPDALVPYMGGQKVIGKGKKIF